MKVRVHDNDSVAGGEIQTGCDRSLMTEVAAEEERLEVRVLLGDTSQCLSCPIGASVVDYESVDGQTACLARRVVEYGADRVFLVEGGNDDGQLRHVPIL